MYLEHFGLQELPFSLTPDTSYFMNRAGYQDGLNVLTVALRTGEGFVKVVGEVGTGKTLLCRTLINSLGDGFVPAYIHNPYLDPDALLWAVADELRLRIDPRAAQHVLLKRLTRRLMDIHRGGRRVVLCLDEVQAMPVRSLETLRLLTNLETEKHKLVQVVLFGQPELDRMLEDPAVRQLRQRISFSYQLLPMNRPALAAYVSHRLRVAGRTAPSPFTRRAIELVHRGSGGIPRLANILCHKALMAAFGLGRDQVDGRFVRAAARDTVDARRAVSPRVLRWLRPRWAASVAAAVPAVELLRTWWDSCVV